LSPPDDGSADQVEFTQVQPNPESLLDLKLFKVWREEEEGGLRPQLNTSLLSMEDLLKLSQDSPDNLESMTFTLESPRLRP